MEGLEYLNRVGVVRNEDLPESMRPIYAAGDILFDPMFSSSGPHAVTGERLPERIGGAVQVLNSVELGCPTALKGLSGFNFVIC